jgi:cysteine-rich repeat protein
MAFCTACTSGYQPVNGVCKFVCGDFVIAGSEVCDDGNSVDKDGCSSTCTVEPDFTCEPDPVQTTGSACFYIGDVTVKEVYINKVDGQNKI